jgi:hypothetical protein
MLFIHVRALNNIDEGAGNKVLERLYPDDHSLNMMPAGLMSHQ